jgi:hypothetical protein
MDKRLILQTTAQFEAVRRLSITGVSSISKVFVNVQSQLELYSLAMIDSQT